MISHHGSCREIEDNGRASQEEVCHHCQAGLPGSQSAHKIGVRVPQQKKWYERLPQFRRFENHCSKSQQKQDSRTVLEELALPLAVLSTWSANRTSHSRAVNPTINISTKKKIRLEDDAEIFSFLIKRQFFLTCSDKLSMPSRLSAWLWLSKQLFS